MKIALINACRYLGGAELWHLAAAAELGRRGHQVRLIARPGPLAERARAAGIPTLLSPMRNDLDFFSFIQLCNWFAEQQTEVVILNDQRDLRLAGSAAFLAGVPVRIHRKGSLHLEPDWRNRLLYGQILTHALAISQAVQKVLLEFGFPSDRLLLVPNGVDLDRFGAADGRPVRRTWQVAEGVPLLGCIGRLSSLKGQDDLLRAGAILRDQRIPFRLALVGQGRIESELRELCRSLQLEDRVIFAGQREDIPAVLAALDVVVQPSVSEALGNAVLEAMAAGKPIVAAATGGIPELIADGERGLLVPPRDPEALARALARLLAEPALASRLALAARRWVAEHRGQNQMMDQLEEALLALLEEAGAAKTVGATGQSPLPSAETIVSRLRCRPGDALARISQYYLAEVEKLREQGAPNPLSKVQEVRGEGPPAPAVSVILPTYNRPEMIRESIESVLKQEFQDWELLVVNDGGGREVEAALSQFPDPRIRYIYAEHGGLSSALNVGQQAARGRYLAYLDDDDIFYPDHLARLVGYLERQAECAVAYADAFRARQQKGPDGRWLVTERTLAFSRDFDPRAFYSQTYIPILCLVHRRSCVAEAGGFNEHILHAMDWEFYLRLSRRYRFHHLARVTGEYRVRDDQTQMTTRAGIPRNYYRNLILFLHDLSPLPSARRGNSGQGSAIKLFAELSRLLDLEPNLVREFELRKLFEEPYYSLFYALGKDLERRGQRRLAAEAFRSARRLAPWEPKTHLAWWRTR